MIMAHLGIFGGSFDPVHNGHLILAQETVEHCGLDCLLVVPAWRSPLKEKRPRLPDATRLDLLRQVFAHLEWARILDLEIRQSQPSYTVETVREISREHPDDSLSLVLGADSLLEIESWKEPEQLARITRFLVARRPGVSEQDLKQATRGLSGLRWELLPTTEVAISSTLVRRRAAAGLGLHGPGRGRFRDRLAADSRRCSEQWDGHAPSFPTRRRACTGRTKFRPHLWRSCI